MKYLIWFFLITTNLCFGQNILSDVEYYKLQDKFRLLSGSNINSAIIVTNQIEKSSNFIHKAFAKGAKSYLYQLEGDSLKSKANYKFALDYLSKSPKSIEKIKTEAYLHNFAGASNYKRSNLKEALNQYLIGKSLSESVNDKIQTVKFNYNIALIYGEIDKLKLAIKITKESEKFIDSNENLYTEEQFMLNKSNIYMNLGSFYEKAYLKLTNNKALIDSALFYYKKTLLFSKNNIQNKLKAQKNIGNIYLGKNNIINAEKYYINVLIDSKENNFIEEYCSANYSLGFLNFKAKNYDKSLIYFQKVDSIYQIIKSNKLEFINSNYFQAKIYDFKKLSSEALVHSNIYLSNNYLNEIEQQTFDINYFMGKQDLKKEVQLIQYQNQKAIIFKNILIAIFIIILALFVFFYYKNYINKKNAEKRITEILENYKVNSNQFVINKEVELQESLLDKSVDETLLISEDNEKSIILKLKVLENKLHYLKPEFTQQEVAKRIKTNTTYLSYIVNKNYNKSFSVYYNELRINYVINEIINNTKYREYTTQAIAESAGFKNADSFTSSFKKKTGFTPYQFINEIKKREL